VLAGVLALGAGTIVVLKQRAAHASAAADEDAASPEASTPAAAAAVKGAPFYLPLDPFIVNLADREADRYLQIGVTFELDSSMTGDQIKALHAGDPECGPHDPRQQDLEGPAQSRRQGAARAGDPARGGPADGHRDRHARAGDDGAARCDGAGASAPASASAAEAAPRPRPSRAAAPRPAQPDPARHFSSFIIQ
jgi:hypothetical protein